MAEPRPVIDLRCVSAGYGGPVIVRDVSLRLTPGVTALVAGNGAGKTTLLRVCAGILPPESGAVRTLGANPYSDAAVRRRIGYLAHRPALYRNLTVRENLLFWGRLYGLRKEDAANGIREVAAALELDELLPVPARRLSRGQQQRAAIARALLGEPELLLLDEPTVGLDQYWHGAFIALVRDFARRGGCVLLASHDPRDFAGADRALTIRDGTLGDHPDYLPGTGDAAVSVVTDGPIAGSIGQWEYRVDPDDPNRATVRLHHHAELIVLTDRLIRDGLTILRVENMAAVPPPARLPGASREGRSV
ncbi:heme ABC exporter ATP-binding protein CcmA [Actinomadura bangladeshensis]|uniref:Heme ABC exporter ATP-binding protein CcmA n=1 Tax=Actinomadura bangladeshensis TaxID=453573 RepID=A0A4R4PBW6_9ACTN|nr:heme ABC exporter ATP-binding protein CcmA [Actinomadura bangladeshensis]TDC20038.1 heme ABC exporter ATP-binding protein CcmA [Actinomadura bangladeshensis]